MADSVTATVGQTERLCGFVNETTFDDLPPVVVDHAKKMIIDSVAVMLAAKDSEPAAIIRNVKGDAYGGDGEARVPTTGEYGTAADVAHLVGVLSHALDFDDVHHRMGGHPSTPVLSALLPVAERCSASGRDLLRAFVLGTEVEVTLADVLNPGHYERGWHPTSVLGTMGAATAVGALFELDTDELRSALGIGASKASGIKGNFGTMTKPLHVGDAARSGLEAAELARGGFTANQQVLELEFGGFCDLFEGDPGYNFGTHIEALGDPWALLDPPVGFKPYPCCGSTHSAIDAALELHEQHDIEPGRIKSVEISEHPRRLDHTNKPSPTTSLDGKFSVQYCVSIALLEGDVWLNHFDDETVTSEPYQSFLDVVSVNPDREAFMNREWGATVAIETPDSRQTVTVDSPTGSAERPMTAAELEEKYKRCASLALDDEAVDRSLETLHQIKSIDDVSSIVDEFV